MRETPDPHVLVRDPAKPSVTAFTLIALTALAIGIVVAYRLGMTNARRSTAAEPPPTTFGGPPTADRFGPRAPIGDAAESPALPQLLAFAEERRRLFGELADARAETARYRQIVVDIEHNAPPPLLDAPGTPDDLRLIVGIGPVIERMLYQLGIATYRQIARWSERDIDEVDARLPEFPGRIRRDAWVTQARALHASKYGSPP
jgi:predicted flap endonuclease-1-like 5' DNA nuclease